MHNLRRDFQGKTLALASFFLVLVTSLHTEMNDRLDALEKEMQEISARNSLDKIGASFVSAQPIPQNPDHWFVTFDIIYWHSKVGGTEYAYSCEPNIVPAFNIPLNIAPPIDGDIKDNDFNWNWGIKVGLGYNMGHNNWDIYAQYT